MILRLTCARRYDGLSMTAFTVNDALMKLAAPNLPFFQQIVLRRLDHGWLFILAALWGLGYRPSGKDRALTVYAHFVFSTIFF
jgi:hypothetical protein